MQSKQVASIATSMLSGEDDDGGETDFVPFVVGGVCFVVVALVLVWYVMMKIKEIKANKKLEMSKSTNGIENVNYKG